jgi:hypothetical protein
MEHASNLAQMGSPHSLEDELSNLSRLQSDALLKAPYDLMSKSEKEAYDRRRLRIADINELLRKCSTETPTSIE